MVFFKDVFKHSVLCPVASSTECHLVVSPSAFGVGFSASVLKVVKGWDAPGRRENLAALLVRRNERQNEIPPVQGKQKAGGLRERTGGKRGPGEHRGREKLQIVLEGAVPFVAKEVTMARDR